MTNNFAEYRAAQDALTAALNAGWHGPIELRVDSSLVINQYNAVWRVKKDHIRSLLGGLRELAEDFEAITAV